MFINAATTRGTGRKQEQSKDSMQVIIERDMINTGNDVTA